jgi:hypothetical protein
MRTWPQRTPRFRAVADWFVWLYAAFVLLANWFFVAFFATATVRVVTWIGGMVLAADPCRLGFWKPPGADCSSSRPPAHPRCDHPR